MAATGALAGGSLDVLPRKETCVGSDKGRPKEKVSNSFCARYERSFTDISNINAENFMDPERFWLLVLVGLQLTCAHYFIPRGQRPGENFSAENSNRGKQTNCIIQTFSAGRSYFIRQAGSAVQIKVTIKVRRIICSDSAGTLASQNDELLSNGTAPTPVANESKGLHHAITVP